MIVNRYLLREVTSPFVVTVAALVLIFTGYSSARYLGEAATGDLPLRVAVALIALKGIIALDAVVPVALFVSVTLGLARLHRDQEISALRAAGLGEGQLLRALALLVVPVALVIGTFSVYLRPAVYAEVYQLQREAEHRLDLARIPVGRFFTPPGADFVLFSEQGTPGARRHVYALGPDGVHRRVIFATELTQSRHEDGARTLHFETGEVYRLDPSADRDGVFAYGELDLHLKPARAARPDQRRKAWTASALAHSDDPKDLAELQWRLSAPLSVIAFGLLAVPVARAGPRQSRQGKVLLALLACTVYYNVMGALQSAVENGAVPVWPGLLGIPLLTLVGIGLLLRRGGRR